MLLSMGVLVEVDQVWRSQGRVVKLQCRGWGRTGGHCGGSGMPSEGASSMSSQTSWGGPRPGPLLLECERTGSGCTGLVSGAQKCGGSSAQRDAWGASHWAPC